MKIIHRVFRRRPVVISFCDLRDGESGSVIRWHNNHSFIGARAYRAGSQFYMEKWTPKLHSWIYGWICSDVQKEELLIKVYR